MVNPIVDTVNPPPYSLPMDNHNKGHTHSMGDTNSREVSIRSNREGIRRNREGIRSNKEDTSSNAEDIHLNRGDIHLNRGGIHIRVGLTHSREVTLHNSRNTRVALHPEDFKTMADSIVLLNWCIPLAVIFLFAIVNYDYD